MTTKRFVERYAGRTKRLIGIHIGQLLEKK